MDDGRLRIRPAADRWMTRAAWTVGVAYGGLAMCLAVLIPYHAFDALALGAWSRSIAETGRVVSSADGAWYLQRPLFYVLQGWLWGITGVADAYGRVLSFAFAAIFVAAFVTLARTVVPAGAAVAVLLLLSVPALAEGAVAGLTDVPVAALVTCTAAALWTTAGAYIRAIAIAAGAAAAALAKPSAFPALAGLAAAHVLGDRPHLRTRLATGVAPLAAGCAVAMAWHAFGARALGLPLSGFLSTGTTTGYYADVASAHRRDAVIALAWLGPALAGPLAFALVYATLRIANASHVVTAVTAALVGSAWLAARGAGDASAAAVGPAIAAALALLVPVVATARSAAAAAPSRLVVGRLCVWAIPPVAAWIAFTPYDVRLLSGAWTPLVLLTAAVVASAFSAGRPWTRVAIGAALICLAVTNLRALDRGWSGWRSVPRLWAAGFDERVVRRATLGPLDEAVGIVQAQIGEDGRLYSSDGRFGYFFPGRHTSAYPRSCADLDGHRVFVLVTDAVTRTVQENWVKGPASRDYWAACRTPRLSLAGEAGDFVVFRIGASAE